MQNFINWNVRVTAGNFLSSTFFECSLFSLDYWSIVHLITAILLMTFLLTFDKYNKDLKKAFITHFSIIFVYEIIEAYWYLYAFKDLFIPETKVNVLLDLVVGMLGALLVIWIYKKYVRKEKS